MKSSDPIFPYKNLFISARPGMGGATLVSNIVNEYLGMGKKCLIFECMDYCHLSYIERLKIINDKIDIDSIRPRIVEKDNLVVIYNYFFEFEALFALINKYSADVVVYSASRHLLDQKEELIRLVEKLKSIDKVFIFTTQIKRRKIPFTHIEKNTPSVSRHRKAIPYFDATVIVYREAYYNKKHARTEELRVYEKGQRKYLAVPVEFDFQKQRVKRK